MGKKILPLLVLVTVGVFFYSYVMGNRLTREIQQHIVQSISSSKDDNSIAQIAQIAQMAQVQKVHPPSQRVFHWNSTDVMNKPTLFTCHPNDGNGLKEVKSILNSVLPEYQWKDLYLKKNVRGTTLPTEFFQARYTNEYDVFIGVLGHYCHEVVEKWLRTHFNGKIVEISGETIDTHPFMGLYTQRLHVFGPIIPKHENDLTLMYFQMTWWQYFQEALAPSKMITSELRPKGNGDNFMIYANSNCVKYREEAVGLLSELGLVHCDGKCQGTTPPSGNRTNLVKTQSNINIGNWWNNVEQKYSNYRFCFVMEHSAHNPAYISEKIIMAFAAGCVPIYYGNERIFDIFNDKAFIFYNISDPQPALDLVAKMESDRGRYDEMMSQPILRDGNNAVEKYFSFSDDIGNGFLKQRMREKLGLTNLVP